MKNKVIVCGVERKQVSEDKIVPAQKVMYLSQLTRRCFLQYREDYHDWSDEQIRTKILETEDKKTRNH